jgi:hypothetical protein
VKHNSYDQNCKMQKFTKYWKSQVRAEQWKGMVDEGYVFEMFLSMVLLPVSVHFQLYCFS